MPSHDVEMDDVLDFVDLDDEDNEEEAQEYTPAADDQPEEGDRLFATTVPCEAEFIWATSNILQQLAKAFHKNSQPTSFHESVPSHLHDFEDVFLKASFD